MNNLRSIKGQTVLPEFVIAFFLVVTAMVAVSIYLQRGLQARERDARTYMIDMASKGCEASDLSGTTDCLAAAAARGNKLAYEYEPYYTVTNSLVNRSLDDEKTGGLNDIFGKINAGQTEVATISNQLPPVEAK